MKVSPRTKRAGLAPAAARPASKVGWSGAEARPTAGVAASVAESECVKATAKRPATGNDSVREDLAEWMDTVGIFRRLVENAPAGIVIHDAEGRIRAVNAQAERVFGYSRQELIGRPEEILMAKRFRQEYLEERKAYMQEPRMRPMGAGLELVARRKDGTEFPVEISLSPLETSRGVLVSSCIFDVTERKQLAEDALRAAILEERARIARDVHDTLVQGLSGVILNLGIIQGSHRKLPDEVNERIARARDAARSCLAETRRSIRALAGSPTTASGLVSSIGRFLDGYRSSTRTKLEFSVKGTAATLDPVVEENLLRIVQQATDNALQHARARTVRVALRFDEKAVRIEVQDDGRGFDARATPPGMGLASMGGRAREISATFRLGSQRGKGTRVIARVQVPGRRPRTSSP